MIGHTISHYKVLEQIGGRGMGVVYKAEDTKLHRQVALKFLPNELTEDRTTLERFQREAQAASALNHPNICTIHDIDEHESQPFIVMELMKGQTLKEKLRRGPLKTDEVLELGIQLADALDAAHSEGIVHREITPANLFVTERGQAKILDFGITKLESPSNTAGKDGMAESSRLNHSGVTRDTVAYMSPEQVLGKELDPRTDLFSLGVVLHEVVTGKPPFTGSTTVAVFDEILHKEPDGIGEANLETPAELGFVISKLLEKDRDLRYQDAATLGADLKRAPRDRDPDLVRTRGAASLRARPLHTVVSAVVAVFAITALVALGYVLVSPRAVEPRFSDLNATVSRLTSLSGQELYPSLSPDGRSLVYSRQTDLGNSDIYLQRVGGQSVTELTADSVDPDIQPRFSPDGDSIAFQSSREGGGIFVMGATGESVRRLTRFGFNPAWSPDGREIVFATESVETDPRDRLGDSELWIVELEVGEPRLAFEGDAVHPDWSPNGFRIAYWAIAGGQRDIWTMTSAGEEAVQVTRDDAVDWNPVWAPDGKFLYFSSDRSGSMNLWRVQIDEETGRTRAEPEPVTTGASGDGMHITLSSDGSRIAYGLQNRRANIMRVDFDPSTGTVLGDPIPVTEGSVPVGSVEPSPDGTSLVFNRVGVQEDIFVSNADGTGVRGLTNDGYFDRYPRWSPDGAKISFYSNRGGRYQVWTINPDGRSLGQLTDGPGDLAHSAWSPDGSRVAYTDFVTGSFIMEVEDQSVETLPALTDGTEFFVAFSWSPDGNWLAGAGFDARRIPQETGGVCVFAGIGTV